MVSLDFLIQILFIGSIITLVINVIIAGFARHVAEEKGYEDGAGAFVLSFFFGIIGFIYAAGLPDLIARGHQQEACYLLRRIASANGISPGAHEKESADEGSGAATEAEGAEGAQKSSKKPVSSVLYNCKSLSVTSKTCDGRCTICCQPDSLSYCIITNDVGTKEIPVCRDCIDRLRERARR